MVGPCGFEPSAFFTHYFIGKKFLPVLSPLKGFSVGFSKKKEGGEENSCCKK